LETYVAIELNLARIRHQKKFRATDPFIFPILIGDKAKLPTEFGLDDCADRFSRLESRL
jgi:hypothetical protein